MMNMKLESRGMNVQLRGHHPPALAARKLYVNTALHVSRIVEKNESDLRLMTLKDSIPALINFDSFGSCFAKGAQSGSTVLVQITAQGVIMLGVLLEHAPPIIQKIDVKATYMYAEYEISVFGRPMTFALLGYPMFVPFSNDGFHPLFVRELPVETTTASYMTVDVEEFTGSRKMFFSRFPDLFELYAEMLHGVQRGSYGNSTGELHLPLFEGELAERVASTKINVPDSYLPNVRSETCRFAVCVRDSYSLYRRYPLSATLFGDLHKDDLPVSLYH